MPPRPILAAAFALLPAAAMASVCQSVAMDIPNSRLIHLAAADAEAEVTISFIAHATFLIETSGGVRIATDFTGRSGPRPVPTVVTMNNAHSTHWTAHPDPAIEHVLRGWPEGGAEQAEHRIEVGDVLARNVPTDIRGWGGGAVPNGNSIFIFEVGQLCIGHLGHLHHTLGPNHYAAIGRLDVVMAPVDGGATLPLPDMISILQRVRASVVLPMHWWGESALERFLSGMSAEFRVIHAEVPSITLTPRTLPSAPSVIVLRPTG